MKTFPLKIKIFSLILCSTVLVFACDSTSKEKASSANDTTSIPEPIKPGWLHTSGNKIYTSDGNIWHGRGVNIHDTRSNWEASYQPPDVELVKAQIDEAVNVWHADFLRLCLETDPSTGPYQYKGILDDPEYLEDIIEIVDYIGTKPNVYVMLSLWIEPTTDARGWPTNATTPVWNKLAEKMKNKPHVIYGIINEPNGDDAAQDPQLWDIYNTIVASIRAVEDTNGTPHHLIAVQGTRNYSRILEYYISHPITAGGGANIIYETHAYVPTADFDKIVVQPAAVLPVIIGEYGPSYMSIADCGNLFELAQELKIPLAAWSFHSTSRPTLLEYYGKPYSVSPDGPLTPTPIWGNFIKKALSSDYGAPLIQNVIMNPPGFINTSSLNFTISASVKDNEGSVSSVFADLSAIGGGSNVIMTKTSGTTYSAAVNLPAGLTEGDKLIFIKAADNEGNVKYRGNKIEIIKPATSDLLIYSSGTFINSYTWGSVTEDTSTYYEGGQSLRKNFNFTGYWADFGICISSSGLNVMGYGALKFRYKLTSSNPGAVFRLEISDLSGNKTEYISIGTSNTSFTEVQIPLSSLQININEISTFMFIINGVQSSSGSLWIDDIRFIP